MYKKGQLLLCIDEIKCNISHLLEDRGGDKGVQGAVGAPAPDPRLYGRKNVLGNEPRGQDFCLAVA